ncbi:hypothetical protein B0I37DRAFT_367167, partial [Chaetomium sp. MPI-CAGE-AT-0009]
MATLSNWRPPKPVLRAIAICRPATLSTFIFWRFGLIRSLAFRLFAFLHSLGPTKRIWTCSHSALKDRRMGKCPSTLWRRYQGVARVGTMSGRATSSSFV